MLFVIIGRDGPEAKELRPRLRVRHLEHLASWRDRGKILLAGPLTDGTGSLVIVDAASHDEALAFAEADPYREGGVFAELEVHPFKKVLP